MKQLITNSTLLELEIILAIFSVSNRTIFELLCRPYSAYKSESILNIAQISDIFIPLFQHWAFILFLWVGTHHSSYFILWLLNFFRSQMAYKQVLSVTVSVRERRWKFLQVSEMVWRLSSNAWTHKSLFFAEKLSLAVTSSAGSWFQHFEYNLPRQWLNTKGLSFPDLTEEITGKI